MRWHMAAVAVSRMSATRTQKALAQSQRSAGAPVKCIPRRCHGPLRHNIGNHGIVARRDMVFLAQCCHRGASVAVAVESSLLSCLLAQVRYTAKVTYVSAGFDRAGAPY
jgi:hypothetical protein